MSVVIRVLVVVVLWDSKCIFIANEVHKVCSIRPTCCEKLDLIWTSGNALAILNCIVKIAGSACLGRVLLNASFWNLRCTVLISNHLKIVSHSLQEN